MEIARLPTGNDRRPGAGCERKRFSLAWPRLSHADGKEFLERADHPSVEGAFWAKRPIYSLKLGEGDHRSGGEGPLGRVPAQSGGAIRRRGERPEADYGGERLFDGAPFEGGFSAGGP